MSTYEPVAIVPESAIIRGRRLRKLWVAGWIFGLFAVLGAAFVSGQMVAYRKATQDLAVAQLEIKRLQEQQTQVTTAFVKAWEDQRAGINLVVSWASFVKEREDLISNNKKSGNSSMPRVAFKGN